MVVRRDLDLERVGADRLGRLLAALGDATAGQRRPGDRDVARLRQVLHPELDRVHPEPLTGVQHEHRPGRAERDVEGHDRERERPHRRMGDEPSDALDHLGDEVALARPLASGIGDVDRDACHEPSTERETRRVRRERQRHPDAEQERADRWSEKLVGQQERARQPRVRDPEVRAGDDLRRQAVTRDVGERLGRAEDEERDQDDRDIHGAGGDRGRKDG